MRVCCNCCYLIIRTILTGLGFLNGNWEELREKASRVILIEPLVEAVMQLTIQFLIILAIVPPNLEKGEYNYINLLKNIVNN